MNQSTEKNTPTAEAILVVDDERTPTVLLTRILSARGYVVHSAINGIEGLKVLEQEPIDLVISDMRMPVMNGIAFLTEVSDRWPDVICILLTAMSDVEMTAQAINKGHIFAYYSKPWDRVKLMQGVEEGLALRKKTLLSKRDTAAAKVENQRLKHTNNQLEAAVKARTKELEQTSRFLEMAYEQIKQAYFQTVNTFSQIVERGEQMRNGHSRRVADLATSVARLLGMDEESVSNINTAGLLHDVGKIGLPDRIRNKPSRELSADDRELMRTHPVEGEAILMSMEPLHRVGELIRHHHERYDGSGYPDGLKGELIPIGSRIIFACDYYDSLVNGYFHGVCSTLNNALNMMRTRSGGHFDPIILSLLIKTIKSGAGNPSLHEERPVVSSALEPGMRVSRTLYTSRRVPLIVADARLSPKLIEKLKAYEQDSGEQFTIFIHPDE